MIRSRTMTEVFKLIYGGVGMRTIKDDILFLVDTGVGRKMLIEWLTDPKSHLYMGKEDVTPYTEAEAVEEIDKLIEDGTLTQGKMHGMRKFIVVTEWSPRTAAQLKGG